MNLLVMDDSDTIKKILLGLSKDEYVDFMVVESDNSKEAFSKLKIAGFNTIVVNLDMANGEGEKFIQKLKSNKVLAKKKILAITSDLGKTVGKFDDTVTILDKRFESAKLIQELKKMEQSDS
jgi:DNA-binding NtrC family response regulator